MNKILFWFKNILVCLLVLLITLYIMEFEFGDNLFLLYLVLVSIYTITSIKDIVYKNDDKPYTILSIITLLIMNFIFIRTLFDSGFIYSQNILSYDMKIYNILYFSQNTMYFIILITLLLIYRKLNIKNNKSILKNSYVFMVLAGVLSIPSLYLILVYLFTGDFMIFGTDFIIVYLIINLLLMGLETFRMIQGKYKDKMCIFIVTNVFHVISLLMTYISLVMH